MTDPASSNVQAWLAKEVVRLGRYLVRLVGDRASFGAIDRAHWVVVLGDAGALKRVGRVLRIRSDRDSTTLHFDRVHEIRGSLAASDVGLTAPAGSIARLRPEDLANVLARDGASVATVPLIEDATYVRELLELATRDDLLGPAEGPEEFIVDMGVRDRYLVGKLAPRKPGEPEGDKVEPAAELYRARGRVEPEEDALDEIDTTNNQSLVPSSMGLTFCVGRSVGFLD